MVRDVGRLGQLVMNFDLVSDGAVVWLLCPVLMSRQ